MEVVNYFGIIYSRSHCNGRSVRVDNQTVAVAIIKLLEYLLYFVALSFIVFCCICVGFAYRMFSHISVIANTQVINGCA